MNIEEHKVLIPVEDYIEMKKKLEYTAIDEANRKRIESDAMCELFWYVTRNSGTIQLELMAIKEKALIITTNHFEFKIEGHTIKYQMLP